MKIYQDIITGDEMLSSQFPFKEVDEVVYEVDCKILDDGTNNAVNYYSLSPTTFDKRGYTAHLKQYLKRVEEQLQIQGKDSEGFRKRSQSYSVKHLRDGFDKLSFYTGPSQDSDGMIAVLRTREDGVTPFLIFWKDGLKESDM